MSEKTAWRAFRENVTQGNDRIDRIENLVGLGFPDTNMVIVGGPEVWLEFKAPREPVRDSTPLLGSSDNHPLSQAQKNWFLRHRKAGGYGFIYIETDRERMLIDHKHADGVNELTVAELRAIAEWRAQRPTGKEQWEALRSRLRMTPF